MQQTQLVDSQSPFHIAGLPTCVFSVCLTSFHPGLSHFAFHFLAAHVTVVGLLLFRSSENRRVVAATVEDADNHQHLVEDGEGDDHSATKADRPQTWPNVVTGFPSVREEGQLAVGGFR